jgi:hypothetical protein
MVLDPRKSENSFDNVVAAMDKNALSDEVDILPALKREDSHGTAPLGWDV